ncbi:MAG: DUF1622 domain-containing protein [Thermoproteota archaeon]|nr:DUF1622 domain-containing protein [Thermoproteota archaeon]
MPHYSSETIAAEAQEETQQPSPSSNESSTSSPQILGQNVENLIRPYVGYITFAIDVSAGIIIGISAIMGLISFLRILRKPVEQQTQDKETIRLRLARGMLLALDFEVGSDILKTILVPSIRELTILAVVVGIRIVLSWSLSKEIGRHADIKAGQSRREATALQTTTSNEINARNHNNHNIASEATEEPNGQRFKQEDRDESQSSSSPPSRTSEEEE